MEWRDHISIDPAVGHGQACIKGTRIPVALMLYSLAAGLCAEEIVASYPPASRQRRPCCDRPCRRTGAAARAKGG